MRKVRLIACAMARSLIEFVPPILHDCIDAAEKFADTPETILEPYRKLARDCYRASSEHFRAVKNQFFAFAYGSPGLHGSALEDAIKIRKGEFATKNAIYEVMRCVRPILTHNNDHAKCIQYESFVRDYINEFINLDTPNPITVETQQMARLIYDEKDWAALPILADKLDDDGYTVTNVQRHLRRVEKPQRGIWSLDFILELQ